ncbi:MAG: hypothetical protein JW940_23170 [Polyangiaceae bacterium]|nr:hypothetical protein [Polyangiaceae bacterium]
MRRASLLVATWICTVPACVNETHDLLPGGTGGDAGTSGSPAGCEDGADCGGAGSSASGTGGNRSVSGTGGKTSPSGGSADTDTSGEGGASRARGTGGDRSVSGTGGRTSPTGGRAGTSPSGGSGESGAGIHAAGAGGGDATGSGGAGGECRSDGRIVITDDSNYSLQSVLSIQTTAVKDGENLTFDWSDVTQDFFGRPIDPVKDIDLVAVSLWGMTVEELAGSLNRDHLPVYNNLGALFAYPKDDFTSVNLLEMGAVGGFEVPQEEVWSRFDMSTPNYQYPPETHTFMMTASSGTNPTRDVRMIGLFKLDPTSTNTTVALSNTSTTMEYSVALADVPPIAVPAATRALTVDWSRMTVNALGNPFDATQITEAVVAHYADYTPVELEEHFLYLREEATAWYSAEVLAGNSVDLGTLTDADGTRFAGIDGTGVWVVALFCTANCNNAAPWSITILRPCE